jgi:hypothetical protein
LQSSPVSQIEAGTDKTERNARHARYGGPDCMIAHSRQFSKMTRVWLRVMCRLVCEKVAAGKKKPCATNAAQGVIFPP